MGLERKLLERDIEKKCVDYARKLGWLARKMNGLAYRAWPDRLFIPPPLEIVRYVRGAPTRAQRVLWVEYKRPGQQPTPLQHNVHRLLRSRGQRVEVVTSIEQFVRLIGSFHG